jgi:predicted MFS family arabinose efflux permease
MRYREWIFLLIVCGIGTGLANWFGYGVSIEKSLPGIIILTTISVLAVVLVKVLPLKLPIIAYCSILGLLSAAPFSPIHTWVINSADAIQFAAPFTIVGSFAGIAIGDKLKQFVSQGWKYVIVGMVVMTGTFLGSCLWDSMTLNLTKFL